MGFNLQDYEEVKDRLPRFLSTHPDGRVITAIESDPAELSTVIVKAYLYKNAEEQAANLPLATGYAFEKEGAGTVNRTSHLENCETSAIGRALANIGLHGSQRPSREEMEKVQRATPKATPTAPAARQGMSETQLQAKRKAYFANCKKLGVEGEQAKETVKGMFNLESFNDATYEQLREAYAMLKEQAA